MNWGELFQVIDELLIKVEELYLASYIILMADSEIEELISDFVLNFGRKESIFSLFCHVDSYDTNFAVNSC